MSKKHNKPQNQQKPDTSVHIPQTAKIKEPLSIREYNWLPKQKQFIDASLDKNNKLIIIDGIWGTGKTLLAVYSALRLLNEKKISSIMYCRNPVESSTISEIGFLKGSIGDKLAPYSQAFYDKVNELVLPVQAKKLIDEERLEIFHLGFARGRSEAVKALIIDESTCFTFDDLMLLVSRMGEHSIIFMIGDSTSQNDIGAKTGFKKFIDTFNDQESRENGIQIFEFKDESDIMRSKFLRFLMGKIKRQKETAMFPTG